MTPQTLDRVFGTARLKMVTGKYVEVYREAAAPGERRRYTKRFLATKDGDFREWTEREWRILARLVGHGARNVPDIVQYDRGAAGGHGLVQTYDAGVTVDHWATLLPVQRDGRVQWHIFQDCAHWWALARHLLLALHEIHPLRLVHLDLKADNICLPLSPPGFDPAAHEQLLFPDFESIALIDFAFSVISGETLTSPLPMAWRQTHRYQSPRLVEALIAGQKGDLAPTRQLDWRCDMYSLAVLLEAILPSPAEVKGVGHRGWTDRLEIQAKALLRDIRRSHDHDVGNRFPHLDLAAACATQLDTAELSASLQRGWTLASIAGDEATTDTATKRTAPLTAVTRIEPGVTFTAVTEVLPQRGSHVPGHGLEEPFGVDKATWPTPAPDVAVPVVEAVANVAAPVDEPRSAGAFSPSANADQTAVRVAQSSAAGVSAHAPLASAQDSPPSDRLSIPPPAAAARAGTGRMRQAAAYLLPGLAVLAAMAWWVAHEAGPNADEPRGASNSSAGVDAANSRATGAPAAAPDAVSSASPAPQNRALPAAAEPPPIAAVGQRPASSSASSPPVAIARGPVEAKPGPGPWRGGVVPPEQQTPARWVSTVVSSAEPRVSQVLSIANRARNPSDDRATAAAAASIGDSAFGQVGSSAAPKAPALARQLNAAARQAFYQDRDLMGAYQLQRRAFDAHPSDVEIAGNLAFYALKLDPPHAEESRAMAIYALALSTRARRPSRMEDWGSLAVASALSGRPDDARDAMLVLLSVSQDVNRSCHSALSSVASHGRDMRMPAEALLLRAQGRADIDKAPQCRYPPKWQAR